MLKISGSNITLTRGDTAYLSLDLTLNNDPYEYEDGDTVTLSVRRTTKDDDTQYLFQKVVTAGDAIVIEPEDTKPLEYGRYKYDVQLNTAKGEVFTVVEPSEFKIAEEVTL